jgi:NTE family protein
MRALVLGGGNALGAYLAGAYEALHRAGEQPDWVAGSSIGAISAALIAGNPPDLRVRRLRTFWELAAAPDWVPPWRRASQWAAALEARLAGRPNLFHPRLSNWIGGGAEHTSFFDPAPLRRVLTRLIDFDMVNSSAVRVSIQAVDLETGEAVAFDTRRDRLEPDHLLASAALIPDFPPVRIGERWLVDGGLAANVPVGLVLAEDLPERSVCYVADPFPPAHATATRPRRAVDAADRPDLRMSDRGGAAALCRSLSGARPGWGRLRQR